MDGISVLSTSAATLLLKIVLNVVCDPEEPKFRRLKVENPALKKGLWSDPGGVKTILQLGFILEPSGEAYTLPPGVILDHDLVSRITTLAECNPPTHNPPMSPAPSQPTETSFGMTLEERAARTADIARRKAEAELEKQRTSAQAKRDQEERRANEHIKASTAKPLGEGKFVKL